MTNSRSDAAAHDLSRADVAALLLRGIDDPDAAVAVVGGLSRRQLRDAMFEVVSLLGAVVRSDDAFREETARRLDEAPGDLDDEAAALEVFRILVARQRADMSLRRTLAGIIEVCR